MQDSAFKYANDVISGNIPACNEVKQACERHLDDLNNGHKRGLKYIPERADAVIQFFEKICVQSGAKEGSPFLLLPWQKFVLSNMYGWIKEDGNRRFRTVYIEVPKKNGKTTFISPLPIYEMLVYGNSESEYYFAATSADQARQGFKSCRAFALNSPYLYDKLDVSQHNIHKANGSAFIRGISSDVNTIDGKKPDIALIDEIHRHKSADLVNNLKSGSISNKNSMIVETTTAGSGMTGICWEHRNYTKRVLENVLDKEDTDDWFGIIYTIDKGDDWTKPETLFKANPSISILDVDMMLNMQRKAINDPSSQNDFKRYHLNIWTQALDNWIDPRRFREAGVAKGVNLKKELLGKEAISGGLDLSATKDFTAFELIFEDEGVMKNIGWCWLPSEMSEIRIKKNPTIQKWISQGWITITDGNAVDLNRVADDIIEISKQYIIKAIAFDPHLAYTGLVQKLDEAGLNMVEQSQSMVALSEPAKTVEKKILRRELIHENNPVMAWMMANVAIYTDPNANIKLKKDKSQDKIDKPVALVIAMAQAMDKTVEQESGFLIL